MLDCWATQLTDKEGLYTGTSLFRNEKLYFETEAEKNLLIVDFLVGDSAALQARISARIVPKIYYGNSDSFCLVILHTWRDLGMSNERWTQLCVSHAVEILLIKALIERNQ